MFVLVTQRPEFAEKWNAVLARRGAIEAVDGLPGLQVCLRRIAAVAVIVDGALLGEAAPGFLAVLRRLCGEAQLLVGDAGFDPEQELLALAAGVAACSDEALAAGDMSRVLDTVLAGGIWISRAAIPALAGKLQRLNKTSAPASADVLDGLTQRQRDVAALVAEGASNKVIARTLDITDRTVKAHLTSIFERLGLTDRLQLALYVTNRNKQQA